MVFIFQFVNMVYHIDWFVYFEESLHPWDKAHLIMMYDPFNVWLDCLLEFCWRFLHLYSSVILTCSFLFCVWHLYLALVSGWLWLHDNLKGWDGVGDRSGVQEGGDICIPMANSSWCMAETNKYCKAIIVQLKINIWLEKKRWVSSMPRPQDGMHASFCSFLKPCFWASQLEEEISRMKQIWISLLSPSQTRQPPADLLKCQHMSKPS